MVRLFIALEADPDFSLTLWRDLEPLRRVHPEFRWIGRDQYHGTLRFLGETEEGYVDSLIRSMEKVMDTSSSNPIPFVLGKLTTFPPRRPASVLALLFSQGEERLMELERSLSAALEQRAVGERIPIRAEKGRPFRAHVTVARSGRVPLVLSPEERDLFIRTGGVFTHLTLFSSSLQKGGPIYHPVARRLL
jgi:2'-5' RNA ligase